MSKYAKCPKCGGIIFNKAYAVQISNIQLSIDNPDELTEVSDSNTVKTERVHSLECTNCKTVYNLLNKDEYDSLIHTKVKCIRCGNEYKEDEVDENGLCIVCQMKEKHKELEHLNELSDFDLIRLIATLQNDNDRLSSKVKEPKQRRKRKAKNVEEETSEDLNNEIQNVMGNEEEPDNAEPDSDNSNANSSPEDSEVSESSESEQVKDEDVPEVNEVNLDSDMNINNSGIEFIGDNE